MSFRTGGRRNPRKCKAGLHDWVEANWTQGDWKSTGKRLCQPCQVLAQRRRRAARLERQPDMIIGRPAQQRVRAYAPRPNARKAT